MEMCTNLTSPRETAIERVPASQNDHGSRSHSQLSRLSTLGPAAQAPRGCHKAASVGAISPAFPAVLLSDQSGQLHSLTIELQMTVVRGPGLEAAVSGP